MIGIGETVKSVTVEVDNRRPALDDTNMLKAGEVFDPGSGRRMEVWCSEAGMQMYTAWHWNETMPGRSGPLKQFAAIAIEPQNFPDAPTHRNFPSAVLRPGEVYRHRVEWRFS